MGQRTDEIPVTEQEAEAVGETGEGQDPPVAPDSGNGSDLWKFKVSVGRILTEMTLTHFGQSSDGPTA